MPAEPPDRTLAHDQLAAMVSQIRPDWHLREATLADSGWTALYHLALETPDGPRNCVLKASPFEDEPAGIDAEARIQAVVRAHTSIPVPEVLGAVDVYETLRTPYFLMEELPGEPIRMAEIGALSDATLRGVARESGRYLGQLHEVDAGLEAFGKGIDYEGDELLAGERPPADPTQLTVLDGYENWSDQLRAWFEEDLELLSDSRFSDLESRLRTELNCRLDALPEPEPPVLGRVDHGWFNLLVDRETGSLEGVVDWGSRFAVPPAFDLATVEHLLAGGWWIALPDVPDRRPLVREALLDGYEKERPVPPHLDAHRACYHLDDLVRWMGLHDRRGGSSGRAIPDERQEAAAAGLRTAAETMLREPPDRA